MASEEERTETASEAPGEKIMIVSLSIFKSQEQAPATIALMIILSQRFDSISNKYFDKKFYGLKRDLVEDAKCNSHNVAKCGKQSKKHFLTRSDAPGVVQLNQTIVGKSTAENFSSLQTEPV